MSRDEQKAAHRARRDDSWRSWRTVLCIVTNRPSHRRQWRWFWMALSRLVPESLHVGMFSRLLKQHPDDEPSQWEKFALRP